MMPASTDAFSSGSGRPTDRGLRAFVACVIGVTSVRFVCAIVENWQSLGAHAEIRVSITYGIAVCFFATSVGETTLVAELPPTSSVA